MQYFTTKRNDPDIILSQILKNVIYIYQRDQFNLINNSEYKLYLNLNGQINYEYYYLNDEFHREDGPASIMI